MKRYKVFFYGLGIGFILCTLYSFYIYLSDPTWGDLTAVASFIVLFPATIFISLILQVVVILYARGRK